MKTKILLSLTVVFYSGCGTMGSSSSSSSSSSIDIVVVVMVAHWHGLLYRGIISILSIEKR